FARMVYEAGIDASKRLGRREEEQVYLGHLGSLYAMLGRSESALSNMAKAVQRCRDSDNRYDECPHGGHMGIGLERIGRTDEAEEHVRRAVEVAVESGNEEVFFDQVQNLAALCRARGAYDMAMGLYVAALENARSRGRRVVEGSCTSNIGLLYSD